jgi:hypothetical protein
VEGYVMNIKEIIPVGGTKMNLEHKIIVNRETGFVVDDGYNHWSPEAGGYISNENGKVVSKEPKFIEYK